MFGVKGVQVEALSTQVQQDAGHAEPVDSVGIVRLA